MVVRFVGTLSLHRNCLDTPELLLLSVLTPAFERSLKQFLGAGDAWAAPDPSQTVIPGVGKGFSDSLSSSALGEHSGAATSHPVVLLGELQDFVLRDFCSPSMLEQVLLWSPGRGSC